MFFELIGFEFNKKIQKNNFWEFLFVDYHFDPVDIHEFKIFLKFLEIIKLANGNIIRFQYRKLGKNFELKRKLSLITHQELDFFLLETEGNSIFKSQIIDIFNKNFEDIIYFFPMNFFIEQEWNFLNQYKDINFLQILTDKDGLIEIEDDFEGKEKYPIYSSILKVKVNNKTYSIQFNNNGFNFPPRMQEAEIFDFLNQTKHILK